MATPVQSSCPPPPPDLQLQLIIDGADPEEGQQGAGSRRPSTASLSRFRSCPQLAAIMNNSYDSPGTDMAPLTDYEGNIIHTSPLSRNSLNVDVPRPEQGGIRSAQGTPTPPSTPGSRRRDPMSSSFSSRSQNNSNAGSPTSTPKQSRRFRLEHGFGSRTFSADSQGGTFDGGFSRDDNLQRMEELCSRDNNINRRMYYDDIPDQGMDDERVSDTDDGSSMHVRGRLAHGHHHQNMYHNEDDSVDKCNRWLQTLKLNKSDKIKSRSHIQLAPI